MSVCVISLKGTIHIENNISGTGTWGSSCDIHALQSNLSSPKTEPKIDMLLILWWFYSSMSYCIVVLLNYAATYSSFFFPFSSFKNKLAGNQFKPGRKQDNTQKHVCNGVTQIITSNRKKVLMHIRGYLDCEKKMSWEQLPHTRTLKLPQERDGYTLKDKFTIRTM